MRLFPTSIFIRITCSQGIINKEEIKRVRSCNPTFHTPSTRFLSLCDGWIEWKKGKWSGRADLNGRPPAPKAGALTSLRYAPMSSNTTRKFQPFYEDQMILLNNIGFLSLLFERPVRPAHLLTGVPRVAPYSSRRHPPAPKAGALTSLRYAPIFLKSEIQISKS